MFFFETNGERKPGGLNKYQIGAREYLKAKRSKYSKTGGGSLENMSVTENGKKKQSDKSRGGGNLFERVFIGFLT